MTVAYRVYDHSMGHTIFIDFVWFYRCERGNLMLSFGIVHASRGGACQISVRVQKDLVNSPKPCLHAMIYRTSNFDERAGEHMNHSPETFFV